MSIKPILRTRARRQDREIYDNSNNALWQRLVYEPLRWMALG